MSKPNLRCTLFLLLVTLAGFLEYPTAAQTTTGSPSSATITFVIVSLQNWLDAGSLKPGRSFSATALNEWQSPACTIGKDAKLYGHITEVSKASKADKTSTLALAFDAADCYKKGKTPLPMMVVEVIGTPDSNQPLFGSMPQEIHGVRQISQVDSRVAQQSADADLPPTPSTVDIGAVQRIPNVRLSVPTVPDGASKLTGLAGNVRLVPGVTLILTSADSAPDLERLQENAQISH